MNNLLDKYFVQVRCSEADVNKEFLKIYEQDKHIKEWVKTLTIKLDLKNDVKADKLRCQGNDLYTSKRFKESFEIYTKAMRTATMDGNQIGLIVANRSALFYMMDYFEDCLNDIDFSLRCCCPNDVKLKLYIRRIKCYAKMNTKDKLEEAKKDALDFLENSCLNVTDEKKTEILSSMQIKATNSICVLDEELPSLMSSNFVYASSVLQLSFDKLRGRHVIANEDIKPGDILFVEKPFSFALVFTDNMEMSSTKCYNCLKTIYSSIPCTYCVKTIYCDMECKEKCWEEFHRWECFGMQCNLWYHIGIGFPALRATIKGIQTGLCSLESENEDDTICLGEIDNSYPYFNKLVSNLSKMENVLPLIISAGVVVLYLEKYTEFFEWVGEQLCNRYSRSDLIGLIGGRITKHIAQLQCNASVIDEDSDRALDNEGSIACAIYPLISMMNHSCSGNIKISYIREVAFTRASEKISKGEEVFSSYGIDYRYADRQTRQDRCSQFYYFTCNCKICRCPELEVFFPNE